MLVDPGQIPKFLEGIHLFSKLSEEQLGLIAAGVHPQLYQAGSTIYEPDVDATDLYILYNGRVQIERQIDGERNYVAELVPGDYFGQEALSSGYRYTYAVAIEDAIVFLLDAEYLSELYQDIPELKPRLKMIARSFDILWQMPTNWRDPSETIYYVARRERFFLFLRLIGPLFLAFVGLPVFLIGNAVLPAMTTPLLIAGMFVFAGLLWGIWSYIDWSNDYYIVTDRRVVFLDKVLFLYDSRTEAPMEAILSVNKFTTQLGRILGYGTVTVRSFTGTIRLGEVFQPQEVQVIIEKLQMRAKARQAVEEKRAIDRTIAGRLGGRLTGIPAPPPAPVKVVDTYAETSGWQRFMVNLLHLRFEQNGVITYRKHWFILLKHTWWPSIVMLSLLVILVARLFNVFTFLSTLAVVVLVVLAGIVMFLWWLYQYVDWTNDIYVLTYDQIIDVEKKPFGNESRKAAPLKNILSIEYERLGFIGYLLNYGTVYIKIGESTFTFDYVFNPSEVQRDIFTRFSEFKLKEKQTQEAADQKRLADWIEGYHRWREGQ